MLKLRVNLESGDDIFSKERQIKKSTFFCKYFFCAIIPYIVTDLLLKKDQD